eukprot:GFKZ01003002.1.p1 GENE.GFKZ01003002.1~~GFKZ01003002.1.p1  ORF type:complete len:398 (-),score=25.53 GFKZ01003002.1:287-1345(-)
MSAALRRPAGLSFATPSPLLLTTRCVTASVPLYRHRTLVPILRHSPCLSLSSPNPPQQSKPRKRSNQSPPDQPSHSTLPASSQSALISSALISLSALSLPLVLSLYETLSKHLPPLSTLPSYTSHFKIILFTLLFATLHSGLASLRPTLTLYTGERLYRILFASLSLPSAVFLISYFIAHRYDGRQLWSIQSLPLVHSTVYTLTFLSFLLLYPATFNLLEVAAIQKPGFRMYETGVTRITRHPQLWGQVLWCIAHTAWMGTSFTLVASLCLIAHHSFGAWNGDRRLANAFGEEWYGLEKRTSIIPFRAVLQGKQHLKLAEFLRPAYVGVLVFVLAAYAAHPVVLRLVGELQL